MVHRKPARPIRLRQINSAAQEADFRISPNDGNALSICFTQFRTQNCYTLLPELLQSSAPEPIAEVDPGLLQKIADARKPLQAALMAILTGTAVMPGLGWA